jgi:hypothetical protein
MVNALFMGSSSEKEVHWISIRNLKFDYEHY